MPHASVGALCPRARGERLSGAVRVLAVLHTEDHDLVELLEESVQHAIGPASGGPYVRQFPAQGLAHDMEAVQERASHDLDDGCRDRLQ